MKSYKMYRDQYNFHMLYNFNHNLRIAYLLNLNTCYMGNEKHIVLFFKYNNSLLNKMNINTDCLNMINILKSNNNQADSNNHLC